MVMVLMVAAALLAFGIQRVFFSWVMLKGLSGEVYFEDREAVKGGKSHIIATVTNRKRIPLGVLGLSFRTSKNLVFTGCDNQSVTDYTYRYDIFSIGGYERIRRRLEINCKKRGYYHIEDLKIETSDLFFTKTFGKGLVSDSWLYVYPENVENRFAQAAAKRIYGAVTTQRFFVEDPFEFRGVREYQTYDSMRDINWKASARSDRLMVNLKSYTSERKVTIFLNMTKDRNKENLVLLEKSISICSSLIQLLVGQGIQVGLVSNGLDMLTGTQLEVAAACSFEHVRTLKKGLARITANSDARSFIQCLQRENERKAQDHTICVLISDMRDLKLSRQFERLCEKHPGSQVISMKMTGEQRENVIFSADNIMTWEVSYAEG